MRKQNSLIEKINSYRLSFLNMTFIMPYTTWQKKSKGFFTKSTIDFIKKI